MLTVTVGDRPLDVAAIVDRGRIMLPMRATFAALGAAVSYEGGRVVVARSASHALRFAIASRNATVDGRAIVLDVAPRVIAARAYVPLRFVAQAFGAVVGYDARAQVVSVNLPQGSANAETANVLAFDPPQNGVASTAFPTISASLGTQTADSRDVRLQIDGLDVTQLSTFDGTTITYMPRLPLTVGSHVAVFSGHTRDGRPFSARWSFQTAQSAPPDAPSAPYDYRFYAEGPATFYSGDWMHFILIAPPGGSAVLQLCNLGYQYPLWNGGYGTIYEANVPAPGGLWMASCPVNAMYTAWNGNRYYVPIPVIVGIYTNPNPRPTGPPRGRVPGPHQPEPTSKPSAAPTPVATPLPKPSAKPPATPRPHPVPTSVPRPHPSNVPVPHPEPPHPHPNPRPSP